MKTLDPSDWKYNGYYENCLKENVDVNTAHGWNYHQGPVSVLYHISIFFLKTIKIQVNS